MGGTGDDDVIDEMTRKMGEEASDEDRVVVGGRSESVR